MPLSVKCSISVSSSRLMMIFKSFIPRFSTLYTNYRESSVEIQLLLWICLFLWFYQFYFIKLEALFLGERTHVRLFFLKIDPFHHCEMYLFIPGTLFFVLMSALCDIDIVTLASFDL